MKFMVTFHLKPGHREQALADFEQRGPSRAVGVSFRDAWIAERDQQVFVLLEAEREEQIAQVCAAWSAHGHWTIQTVISIDQV